MAFNYIVASIQTHELWSIDAFCVFLQKLLPAELHLARRKMIGALDRKKLLSKLKMNDGYLLLAISRAMSDEASTAERTICHKPFKACSAHS